MKTDTERLEFLMRFFEVADTGDDTVCPGMVVDTDAVSEAFDYGALADELVPALGFGVWDSQDMRRAIDKAMEFEKRKGRL